MESAACRGSDAPPGTRGKFSNQRCLYPVACFPILPTPPVTLSPSPGASSYPSCLSGREPPVFSSLPSVCTLLGATEGERDSQAPSPGLYRPPRLVQGGAKPYQSSRSPGA